MKEPKLADFGLTQDNVDNYLTKKQKFDDEYKKHIASNKNKSFFITWAITTVIFCVIFIIYTLGSIEETADLLIYICMPFLSLFIAFPVWASTNNPYKFLDKGQEIKRKYINIDIENRYFEYKKAVNEFNDYQERCSRAFWEDLNGLDFEKEVAKLYKRLGYETTLTPATADGGIDIILRKNGRRIAVQCKHHKNPVGPNDVRALQGVVVAQKFDSGVFISLNGYTPTVRQEIRSTSDNVKIELLELNNLVVMMKNLDKEPTRNSTPTSTKASQIKQSATETSLIEDYDMVYHKKFGTGQVTLIKDNRITCKFNDGEHTFVFPDTLEIGILRKIKNLLLLIKPVEERLKEYNITYDIINADENYEKHIALECFVVGKESSVLDTNKKYKVAILYSKDKEGNELLAICGKDEEKIYKYSHDMLFAKIVSGLKL